MATETRTNVGDEAELMQAAYAYCLRKAVDLPRAKLKRVLAEPEATGVVRLVFEAQDASQTEIALSYSQMAAAFIMHCGVIGVPLPLMSAGLSALLSTFVAIGFVVSVKLRRFVN